MALDHRVKPVAETGSGSAGATARTEAPALPASAPHGGPAPEEQEEEEEEEWGGCQTKCWRRTHDLGTHHCCVSASRSFPRGHRSWPAHWWHCTCLHPPTARTGSVQEEGSQTHVPTSPGPVPPLRSHLLPVVEAEPDRLGTLVVGDDLLQGGCLPGPLHPDQVGTSMAGLALPLQRKPTVPGHPWEMGGPQTCAYHSRLTSASSQL